MLLFKTPYSNIASTIFKTLSQNLEYVKTHCNDRISSFHIGIRKWMMENGS